MKYFLVFIFSIIFLSCNNDKKSPSFNTEDQLYLQVVFEDFFQNDLLDLWINNKKILEKDSLNSGFSDGITNTSILIFSKEGKYVIKVHDKTIFMPIKDSLIALTVILDSNNTKFQINPDNGIYVGLNKRKDGTLRITQSKIKPLYD